MSPLTITGVLWQAKEYLTPSLTNCSALLPPEIYILPFLSNNNSFPPEVPPVLTWLLTITILLVPFKSSLPSPLKWLPLISNKELSLLAALVLVSSPLAYLPFAGAPLIWLPLLTTMCDSYALTPLIFISLITTKWSPST